MIRLPERTHSAVDSLTPREIVGELDKYVIGQKQAKRAVAIALRNRMRRQKLPPELVTDKIWKQRLKDMRNFERYLGHNGVIVRKGRVHGIATPLNAAVASLLAAISESFESAG